MKNLQRALAGSFQKLAAVFTGCGRVGAQGVHADLKAGREVLFSLAPSGVRRALFVFQDSIFFEAEAVEFITKCEVAGEGIG